MTPKRIGLIGFTGASTIDLAGPAQAFSIVEIDRPGNNTVPGYEILTIGESVTAFKTDSGLIYKPNTTFEKAPPLDTIIIPGGQTLRHPRNAEPIADFVRQHVAQTRRIAALSTGIYGLAATGVLSERRVATHWRYSRDVALRFPTLIMESDALFVKDENFYTCAGASAGIDLALSLIEEDYGPRIAFAVARDLVVHLKRSGDQEQYSEALQFQAGSVSRLSDLTTWITSHLDQDLSVENLAAKACLCPRQFGRRFKTEIGSTPADFVEKVRLNEARHRLSTSDATIENISASVGFRSSDVFRRRFEHQFGVAPTEFRRRSSKVAVAARSDRRTRRRSHLAVA
jgi:transcriptional regulator GlxA family with amidase domain